MAKYHINPETGVPGICKADPSKPGSRGCRFGSSDDEHYGSKEEAARAYEARMDGDTDGLSGQTSKAVTEARIDKLQGELIRPENSAIDFDIVEKELSWIREWHEDWTDDDRHNLAILERMAALTSKEDWTAQDEKEAEGLLKKLKPAVERPYIRTPGGIGYSTADPSARDYMARDKNLNTLTENLLRRRRMDELQVEPVDGEEDNPRLMGLRAAQEDALRRFNHSQWNVDHGTSSLGAVEPHLQEAISRVTRGDSWHELAESTDHRSLLSERERIFATLHPDAPGSLHDNQLYLSTVYPVNELKAEMDRVGIDGVSVSSLDNGREQGNVYTVMTPDGGTRSFSVYEHRNSDSIIINGKDNWNGDGLPYATDSKNGFYAEFAPEDRQRSAQALTFYMMQAQSGTLESDEELTAKATRRDWNAILDRSIPGFKAWRQEKITDSYIAPEQENEEDILKRLDF